MKGNQADTKNSAREAGQSAGATRKMVGAIGTRAIYVGGAVLILAAAAIIIAMSGCGTSNDEPKLSESAGTPAVVAQHTGGTGETPLVTGQVASGSGAEKPVSVSADSLPPEVAAWVADSSVAPGSIVEITAEGSSDVGEITLADGVGKRLAFAYDSATGLWKTFYRVPIKTSGDRLALSVTARNDVNNRWRRVWVFLKVQRVPVEQSQSEETGDECQGHLLTGRR